MVTSVPFRDHEAGWRRGELPGGKRDESAVEYDGRGRPPGRPNEHSWAADGPYWFLRGNGRWSLDELNKELTFGVEARVRD